MPRYKITIEYDGQDFHGWQRQNKLKTIQGELETALYKFCGEKIKVFGAGRTDTGVHALAQVAHLDVDKNKLEDKLNKLGKIGSTDKDLNFSTPKKCVPTNVAQCGV